jgi:hypothetical protein
LGDVGAADLKVPIGDYWWLMTVDDGDGMQLDMSTPMAGQCGGWDPRLSAQMWLHRVINLARSCQWYAVARA